MPALQPHHLHRRDISISVSNKDHALERDRSLFHRYPFVHGLVVPIIDYSFIDSEKKLSLRRVINGDAGPCSQAFTIKDELRCEYVCELVRDPATFDDLLIAG